MRRQRCRAQLRLPFPSVAAVVAHVVEHRRELMRDHRLWVRSRPDGRLRARLITGGRGSTPPFLRGVLRQDDSGVRLEATVRESRLELLWLGLYAGAAVFSAGTVVRLLVHRDFRSPGVPICGLGAVVLGFLAALISASRRGSFPRQADELIHALERALQAGTP